MLFFKQVFKRVGSAKKQTIFNVSVLTDPNATSVSNLTTSLMLAWKLRSANLSEEESLALLGKKKILLRFKVT